MSAMTRNTGPHEGPHGSLPGEPFPHGFFVEHAPQLIGGLIAVAIFTLLFIAFAH